MVQIDRYHKLQLKMSKNIFIFVVCGAKEHIDTLHFSLPYLQKRTKNEIWILTDSTRNETPIQYEGKIIDIKTPKEFDNHQASIYLKTGIYQFVPKGNRYCYLDTDIIAFSEEVDAIFKEYVSPITFAPDHCTMEKFSLHAVKCSCTSEFEKAKNTFDHYLSKVDPLRNSEDKFIQSKRLELQNTYLKLRENKFKALATAIRYFTSYPKFHLSSTLFFDKKERIWKATPATPIMNDFKISTVARQAGLKWSLKKQEPTLQDGRSIWFTQCNHLLEEITHKFNINISQPNFQHWNGGVFLFDDTSHDFLEAWFSKTMEIFKDPKWKTRDQGTLIATVWEFGLQNHPTLNKRWNLIADYNKPIMEWEGDEVRIDVNEKYSPVLIHVYHHFGDENWSFWNELMQKVNG